MKTEKEQTMFEMMKKKDPDIYNALMEYMADDGLSEYPFGITSKTKLINLMEEKRCHKNS